MSALASHSTAEATPAAAGGTFTAPTSVDDVLAAIAGGQARIVAGGTDLVVGSRQGKWSVPEHLVAIHRVAALRGIRPVVDGGLWLGALVTHGNLRDSQTIRTRYTALADAASIVGSRATQGVGTIGGNLVNASPAAETSGPFICFDATCSLESLEGRREVTVEELFVGPGRTIARSDELLVSVALPAPREHTGSAYARLEYRRQMEIAVVGASAVVSLRRNEIVHARVAITSLAPTVRRVPAAEELLLGSYGGREAAERAGEAAAAASRPIDDVRAAADYRRAMAAVITRRVVLAAVARARGETVAIPASANVGGQ